MIHGRAARRGSWWRSKKPNQQMLAHNLESGEWTVRGNEVSVKVAMSQVMFDVALGDAPRANRAEALAKAAGKPMKFKMVSGGAQFTPKARCGCQASAAQQRRGRAQPGDRPIRSCSACRKSSARRSVPSSTIRNAGKRHDLAVWKTMSGIQFQEMLAQARQQAEKLRKKCSRSWSRPPPAAAA